MPNYTYVCHQCGESIEVLHGINTEPELKCSECGGELKKVFGKGSVLLFKGTGFYETDYKNK